jgi:ABC-2 type transport system permease protein
VIGLIPFAALGVVLGHLGTPDSIGPIMGGSTALLALLGGTWFPVTGGVMQRIAELLPSYWLVQAGHSAFTGEWWPPKAWVVLAVWTAVFVVLAQRAYQRDTLRV